MDVGLRVPLEATVEREGVVVLPARLLVDVVRSLPAAKVSLELRSAEQDVELVSGKANFHIRTLRAEEDRKSTRLNSSHANISYAVFCLKKKKKKDKTPHSMRI